MRVINEIAANKHKMYDICKPFFTYIRSNEELPECTRAIHELKWYYATHFNKKIDSVKSTASKDKYIQMKDEGLATLQRNLVNLSAYCCLQGHPRSKKYDG